MFPTCRVGLLSSHHHAVAHLHCLHLSWHMAFLGSRIGRLCLLYAYLPVVGELFHSLAIHHHTVTSGSMLVVLPWHYWRFSHLKYASMVATHTMSSDSSTFCCKFTTRAWLWTLLSTFSVDTWANGVSECNDATMLLLSLCTLEYLDPVLTDTGVVHSTPTAPDATWYWLSKTIRCHSQDSTFNVVSNSLILSWT